MKLIVERYEHNKNETIGKLYIDGKFECYTLEDEFRATKVYEETRIPQGTYKIKLRTVGEFNNRYLKKYPKFHKGMLHVTNVPGFEYILIHIGNTEKDTAGCLLVGATVGFIGKKRAVLSSGKAYEQLYPKVLKALESGKEVTIEYKDC